MLPVILSVSDSAFFNSLQSQGRVMAIYAPLSADLSVANKSRIRSRGNFLVLPEPSTTSGGDADWARDGSVACTQRALDESLASAGPEAVAMFESRATVMVVFGRHEATEEAEPWAWAVARYLFERENSSKRTLRTALSTVWVMKPGFDVFAQRFPFICTTARPSYDALTENRIVKQYPSEIIPNALYLGAKGQAADKDILRDLGITHIVRLCDVNSTPQPEYPGISYCTVQIEDDVGASLAAILSTTQAFIISALGDGAAQIPKLASVDREFISLYTGSKTRVLVHCAVGRSRSVSVVAWFCFASKFCATLRDSLIHVMSCRQEAQPNAGFIEQLQEEERKVSKGRTSILDTDLQFESSRAVLFEKERGEPWESRGRRRSSMKERQQKSNARPCCALM